MADIFEIGNQEHNSEQIEFQIKPITVEVPEINWLLIIGELLAGITATAAATA